MKRCVVLCVVVCCCVLLCGVVWCCVLLCGDVWCVLLCGVVCCCVATSFFSEHENYTRKKWQVIFLQESLACYYSDHGV